MKYTLRLPTALHTTLHHKATTGGDTISHQLLSARHHNPGTQYTPLPTQARIIHQESGGTITPHNGWHRDTTLTSIRIPTHLYEHMRTIYNEYGVNMKQQLINAWMQQHH